MTIDRTPLLVVAVMALVGRASSAVAQCAMCGNSFGQNDPTMGAFNTSVLFLMLAPYTIFFAAAGVFVFLYRRGLLARRAPVIPLHGRRTPAPADGPKEVTP
jgi:hypothetical protein